MLKISAFFLAGIVLLHALPALPGAWLAAVIAGLWLLTIRSRLIAVSASLAAGFLWAWCHAERHAAEILPPALAGQDVTVTGFVASIPQRRGNQFTFLFDVTAAPKLQVSPKIRLSWYSPERPPAAGEHWRLTVRLRAPRGFSNPGGFDYEAWLLRQGVGATGYVRASPAPDLLVSKRWQYPLLKMRAAVARELRVRLDAHPMRGLVTALAVGERGAMGPGHWRVLSATGTNHLMAISGLHIGLVAGLGFLLAGRVWRAWPRLRKQCAAKDAGIVTGAVLALCYALLAGLSIPTQRALIMLIVALGVLWRRRVLAPDHAFGVALLIVLGAVGVILWTSRGRWPGGGRLIQFARIQGAVCLGIAPLTLAAFGSVSLAAPVVNFVMIPLFTVIVIPLILAGLVLLFCVPPIGAIAIETVAGVLGILWAGLAVVADWGFVRYDTGAPPWAAWLMVPGVALLLAPKGVPARYLGLIFMLPAIFWRPPAVPPGGVELTLLDVGQGLAAVLRTHRHALVYDAGPSFRSGADTGELVLIPFLRAKGVRNLDGVMLSHGDQDHIGGAASLLRAHPGTPVIGSDSAQASFPDRAPCRAGHSWTWDEVRFSVIHPAAEEVWDRNDGSCVLWVRTRAGSILLAGDIEAEAEGAVLRRYPKLAAEVVIAPHHGSRTSSTAAFVRRTRARYVLFAAGHRNRWGFPVDEVVDRWRDAGARALITADSGAITVVIDPEKGVQRPLSHRLMRRRHWTAP